MDEPHDTVRAAPASPGDAGPEPQRDAGAPGAAREETPPSSPPGAEHAVLSATGADNPSGVSATQKPLRHQRNKNRGDKSTPAYAAIDLGTNNCRLLVAQPAGGTFEVIDAFSRIVRLGEGLGNSDELSAEAMDRAVGALRICAAKMRRRNVARARVIATQACRHAVNSGMFIERVARETGLELEVVTPEEEARLAVLGCTPLLDKSASRALVFDIGGGSTELVWLDMTNIGPAGEPHVLAWASLPVGVVTLADRYDGRTLNRTGYEKMVQEVTALLNDRPWSEEMDAQLDEAVAKGDIHLLGTSGTVTTIAGIHLGLRRYDRSKVDGTWIDFADVSAVTQALSLMTLEERANVPCIGRERADLVLAGCAILEAIQTSWPCRRLRVADRGLREGILITLMREDRRNQKRKRRRRRGGRKRAQQTNL
ncbi:Ppx/GppA phosphatase family protein [Pyruvatibacter sp.]|uniref:Ppx/GppA phosphatase family protein n=1 Tax=Pyruvatibacter sp. TaxID=1981328 RepID=UPI0032EAF171